MEEMIRQLRNTIKENLAHCEAVRSIETTAKSSHKVLSEKYVIEAKVTWKFTRV